jgi:hypothetical protein
MKKNNQAAFAVNPTHSYSEQFYASLPNGGAKQLANRQMGKPMTIIDPHVSVHQEHTSRRQPRMPNRNTQLPPIAGGVPNRNRQVSNSLPSVNNRNNAVMPYKTPRGNNA